MEGMRGEARAMAHGKKVLQGWCVAPDDKGCVPFSRQDACRAARDLTEGTGTHRGLAEKESWN